MNRGGVYPQPDRVVGLGVDLLNKGCSEEEANHEGVCVQEVPAEHRAHDPSYTIVPYETYAQYNARSCGQQGPLKTCFPEDALLDILYGTLSHCHLLLVLLCLSTGATWEWPEKLAKLLLNTDGTINYAVVAAYDKGFASLITAGLQMEILSWKIYMEEPTACGLISQLVMTSH